jgi:hypothetical protein
MRMIFFAAGVTGLSSLGVWIMYMLGQFLHILLTANLAVHSKINGIASFGIYFKTRWIPIVCRLFLTTLTFVLVWDNPALVNIESLMHTTATQIAMAGILGWFSDSVFDKVLSVVPWLQRELPAIEPPAAQ